jgi:hypothetical protein
MFWTSFKGGRLKFPQVNKTTQKVKNSPNLVALLSKRPGAQNFTGPKITSFQTQELI